MSVLRAVVFDFDGLILDTEVPVFEAWREVYAAHGVALDLATWQRIIGTHFDPAPELERQVGRALAWDEIEPRRRARRDELQAAERIRPGILEWLEDAARYGLDVGVASSSSREWVLTHLDRLELTERFTCIRCWDDVGEPKPSPASYRAVIDELGARPDQAVALEDSVHGVAAAKAAGLWCVAVPGPLTRGMDFSAADLTAASLQELPLAVAASRLGLVVTEA